MTGHDARVLGGWLAAVLPFLATPASAALQISSDFESGSARVLALDDAGQVVRLTPAGTEARGWTNWWYFRVEGIDASKPLTVEVQARESFVPMEGGAKKILLNPSWTLPSRAAFSTDGKTWAQTAPGHRNGRTIVYRWDTPPPRLWLAWGPPFTPADAAAFVARLEGAHPFVRAFTLATSLEGRPVPALRLSETGAASARRPAIWVTARQHAWECGGTWTGIGLAEWLAGNDPAAVRLRREADFFFVPVLDVDHVATGDGGKAALPQDHNRDWSESPHWPEVAAVQQQIRQLAGERRLAVFLDLHNPAWGATLETFYGQHPPYVAAAAAGEQERFLAGARREFGQIRLIEETPNPSESVAVWRHISAAWVAGYGNPDTVSFTVETPWNTPDGTIGGYRRTGEKLGRVLAGFIESRAP